jgi:hypothetical protein
MRFLKRHYEKIILSLVLLALGLAAAWLPSALSGTREKLQGAAASPPPPKLYKPLDMSATIQALDSVKAPPPLVLNGEHNLFNPVVWKRKYDGSLIKITTGKEEGPGALAIVKITPLHFIIAYSRVAGSGYFLDVTRELSPDPHDRRKGPNFISATAKPGKGWFALRSVKGTAEEPVLVLELLDGSKELISVSAAQTFDRVEGYAADLHYDLEKKDWNDQREDPKGARPLFFAGDAYKIVYIDKNEVRVMANSNNKQTTIRWNPAP